ncbi:MAG: sigma-70 family RNA polymerase sigma factor [Eubacterium sp.]|nr:sigma-70 family RNA polymerase sigma factor [Eubacterium sp.]
MKRINLRELYPLYYTEDYYIEVSDEVAEQIKSADRAEHAYTEKIRYHKAYYSLDAGDDIEKESAFVSRTPQEIYERKLYNEELYAAISELPDKQAKRIYARYFQNMSLTDIAKTEGISVTAVKSSIDRALRSIARILKNI